MAVVRPRGLQRRHTRRVALRHMQRDPRRNAMRTSAAAESSGKEGEPRRDWRRAFATLWYWNKDRVMRPINSLLGRSSARSHNSDRNSESNGSPVQSLDGQAISSPSSNAVLVLGASGGLGKRVVHALTQRGMCVRALCRNEQPLHRYVTDIELRQRIELVRADIAQPQTVQPSMLSGVHYMIDASAAKVGPSEGDDEERSKYMQGIKFYDPEVEENPENVEWKGIENLVSRLREQIGTREGVQIFPVKCNTDMFAPLDDVVMGGVSDSSMSISSNGFGIFSGTVRTARGGGFASIRSNNLDPALDLSAYDGLRLRVLGDGYSYKLVLKNNYEWDTTTYAAMFDTIPGEWITVHIPWKEFIPNFRAQVVNDAHPLHGSHITSLQFMLSKFRFGQEENPNFPKNGGEFKLEIAEISTYIESTEETPRIVQVSSGGVTRWNRPNLGDDEGISRMPIQQVNEMLSYLLTYKLYGEDVVRASGAPYTIVRPCALTEEPGGMPIEFDQGDTIQGKVGRDDVADLCASALSLPELTDCTFEMRASLDTSEEWTGSENGEHTGQRDWRELVKSHNIRPGVTGKSIEINGQMFYTGQENEEEFRVKKEEEMQQQNAEELAS